MPAIRQKDLEESDEMFLHRTIITDKGQSPIRIDKFLFDKLEDVYRNRVQNAIKAGCILVNDQVVKANYKVRPHETISLVLPSNPEDQEELQAENIPLNIVFEDDHVLVINKEPGLVVHPGIGNHSGTLVNALLYHFRNVNKNLPILQGNNAKRAGLVHRIDKDTSGLLVIAKTEFAMTHLAKQFFDHSLDRTYIGLMWSSPEEPKGTIIGNLDRHTNDRMRMTVTDDGSGKHAVTHYEVLEDLYYVSLIRCVLETGRTHQIRAHMKHIGCTLFNDERYGGNNILKGTIFTKYKQFVQNCFDLCPRQALHAATLGFIHPGTGNKIEFEAPLPEDMSSILQKWRDYHQTRKELK